jgi:trehalose-6-phosphatase
MRWKEDVMKIFENVTDFTPGSLVEEKEINVTWHYRNADPGNHKLKTHLDIQNSRNGKRMSF